MEKNIKLLVFIKPGFADNISLVNDVKNRIVNAGLKIVKGEYVCYLPVDAEEHYIEHAGRPYLPTLVNYATSGPIYGMVVSGPESTAVETIRRLAGRTIKIKPEYKDKKAELEAALCEMSYEEACEYFFMPEVGSIRHELIEKYGYRYDMTKNIMHSSDSAEAGKREIAIFKNAVTRENSIDV